MCKSGKHYLYACPKFKSLPHEEMMSILRSNHLCMNCLKHGHFASKCPSNQKCRKCQKPHHTLLHLEDRSSEQESKSKEQANMFVSHVAQTGSCRQQALLMTCLVQVTTADCRTTQARALLDSASSTSFMSEHLAQLLRLPRTRKTAHIAGIGGLSNNSLHQSVVHFSISPLQLSTCRMDLEAVVLPKVTLNLPTSHVPLRPEWDHLSGLDLADPHFGSPGAVDLLLGVDVFTAVLGHGRR